MYEMFNSNGTPKVNLESRNTENPAVRQIVDLNVGRAVLLFEIRLDVDTSITDDYTDKLKKLVAQYENACIKNMLNITGGYSGY